MLKKSSGQIYNTYNKFLGHETIFLLALTKTEHNFNSILAFVLGKSVPPKVKKSVIWRGLKKEPSPSLEKNECNVDIVLSSNKIMLALSLTLRCCVIMQTELEWQEIDVQTARGATNVKVRNIQLNVS